MGNPYEQFLHPLIGAIVKNTNIEVDVRVAEHSVVASVLVDEKDQSKVIGKQGRNVTALSTIFEAWCQRTFQLRSRLAILEPIRAIPPAKLTKVDPKWVLSTLADWLFGELFPESIWAVTLDKGSDPETKLQLNVSINEEIDIKLLTSLTNYFRAAGQNAGVPIHFNLRRVAAGSSR